MPGMPEFVLKAPVLKRISDATRIPGAQHSTVLQEVIADLKDPTKKLVDVAISAGMYADHAQAKHLQEHWFDDPPGNGFWRQSTYKVEELVRATILKALELFAKTGKPIDALWIRSGHKMTDPWQAAVTELPNTIVVLFYTPNIQCNVPLVDDYSIWIVEQTGTQVKGRKASKPAAS